MSDGAFISVAGHDKEKVNKLIRNAPKLLYNIYQYDFQDAKSLLDQMKHQIEKCTVFIFFASHKSINSTWCKFELQLSELEHIKRGIKIFVLPIEAGITISFLPDWMKQYWISFENIRRSTIERRFQNILEKELVKRKLFGAAERASACRRAVLNHYAATARYPNIFYFTGIDGIGRVTTAVEFLRLVFENERFSLGPMVELRDPASIEDLYMRLQDDIEALPVDKYEEELRLFRNLDNTSKIENVFSLIETICQFDETLYIRCKSGLFGDDGRLIEWADRLLKKISRNKECRLVIISNRQPRAMDLHENQGLFSYQLTDLPNEDITALIQSITISNTNKALRPSEEALILIGGHPVVAHHYGQWLSQHGEAGTSTTPYDIIQIQKRMFYEFLKERVLSEDEQKILCILSWFPRIESSLLEELFNHIVVENYAHHVQKLNEKSLIFYRSGFYHIYGPVRIVYRQMYGIGDNSIIKNIVDVFRSHLESSEELSPEMLDNFVFICNLHGTRLPEYFESIMSPSSLLASARELYSLGRDQSRNDIFERCISICDAVIQISNESALMLEVQAVKARALMRIKEYGVADTIISSLERQDIRQAQLLRAQYYRFQLKYDDAANIYVRAINSGINSSIVIHEYCICLRALGKIDTIRVVMHKYANRVNQNIYLLDLKASLEIGEGEFIKARNTIQDMGNIRNSYCHVAKKTAILLAAETQDYQSAIATIDSCLEIEIKNVSERSAFADLYITRCILHCKNKDVDRALNDFQNVRAFHRKAQTVLERLEVHILLARGMPLEAHEKFNVINDRNRLDDSLQKEILYQLIQKPHISLVQKKKYKENLAKLARSGPTLTPYDI